MISHAIFKAAGEPTGFTGESLSETGCCRLCGAGGAGVSFTDWVRPTFTDHDLLLPGEIVCKACLFCFQERTEWLMRRVGRDKPQRFRTYSHFVHQGTWHVLTKGDKEAMRALLAGDPDVALIAESGQKHIILYAKPGFWQFELQPVRPNPERLTKILHVTDEMYTRGASKTEMRSGSYSQGGIRRVGPSRWRDMEREMRSWRGSPLFDLALFLTQKTDIDYAEDEQPTPARGHPARGQLPLFG